MVANCSPAEITAVCSEPQLLHIKNGQLASFHTAAREGVQFRTTRKKTDLLFSQRQAF
jgi:hypothetical protein